MKSRWKNTGNGLGRLIIPALLLLMVAAPIIYLQGCKSTQAQELALQAHKYRTTSARIETINPSASKPIEAGLPGLGSKPGGGGQGGPAGGEAGQQAANQALLTAAQAQQMAQQAAR